MSPTIGSKAGGAASARPPWWMFVLALAFIGYYSLLIYCDLTRREPTGFVFAFHQAEMMVGAVAPGSSAARAGLQAGDRVMAANGSAIRSRLDWQSVELNLRIDRPLRLEIARAERREKIAVVLNRAGP